MVDKTHLSPQLWARMMWLPQDGADGKDRPVVLVTDRGRLWLAGIPLVAAFLLAVSLFILHAPAAVVITMLLVVAAIGWFARDANAFYEVRPDGRLGEYLGRRAPARLQEMRRTPL